MLYTATNDFIKSHPTVPSHEKIPKETTPEKPLERSNSRYRSISVSHCGMVVPRTELVAVYAYILCNPRFLHTKRRTRYMGRCVLYIPIRAIGCRISTRCISNMPRRCLLRDTIFPCNRGELYAGDRFKQKFKGDLLRVIASAPWCLGGSLLEILC